MKALLRPLFRKLYFAIYRNGKKIRINGEQYVVSAYIARGINNTINEKPYNILEKLCENANVVFDIGASNGIISLLLSKHMKPGSIIHSFEPTPSIYKYLKDTARVQKGNSIIKPYNLAMGSSPGNLHFEQGKRQTMNYVVKDSTATSIEVKTETLDNFCRQQNVYPDAIKIDVEGWEYEVLLGAKEMLSKNECVLLIEMHQDILRRNGVTPEQFNDLIKDIGYTPYNKEGEILNYPFAADWVLVLSKKPLAANFFQ